jgi:hypothetical protein
MATELISNYNTKEITDEDRCDEENVLAIIRDEQGVMLQSTLSVLSELGQEIESLFEGSPGSILQPEGVPMSRPCLLDVCEIMAPLISLA